MNTGEHWESVYRNKGDTDLSWFQIRPTVSLHLIESLSPTPRRVIDVGGGQSALAGELVDRGIDRIAVLDICSAAIERQRSKMGPRAARVEWLPANILQSPEIGQFDLWHDRALFHFFCDPRERERYLTAVRQTVVAGGHVVVGVFSKSGPETCSGLPVRRYDAASLAVEFGESFELVTSTGESHRTPWGKTQDFVYVLFKRL